MKVEVEARLTRYARRRAERAVRVPDVWRHCATAVRRAGAAVGAVGSVAVVAFAAGGRCRAAVGAYLAGAAAHAAAARGVAALEAWDEAVLVRFAAGAAVYSAGGGMSCDAVWAAADRFAAADDEVGRRFVDVLAAEGEVCAAARAARAAARRAEGDALLAGLAGADAADAVAAAVRLARLSVGAGS